MLADAPRSWHEHDQLTVGGAEVDWWVNPDGEVHAATMDGLARGLAWSAGRWDQRQDVAAVLADPRSRRARARRARSRELAGRAGASGCAPRGGRRRPRRGGRAHGRRPRSPPSPVWRARRRPGRRRPAGRVPVRRSRPALVGVHRCARGPWHRHEDAADQRDLEHDAEHVGDADRLRDRRERVEGEAHGARHGPRRNEAQRDHCSGPWRRNACRGSGPTAPSRPGPARRR